MNITSKETIKKVTQTAYETSDGETFTDLYDAQVHQSQFEIKEILDASYEDDDSGIDYYIIKSKEDFELFQLYFGEFKGWTCSCNFDLNDISFPFLLSYDCDGRIVVVDEKQYVHHRKICQMFEDTIKKE